MLDYHSKAFDTTFTIVLSWLAMPLALLCLSYGFFLGANRSWEKDLCADFKLEAPRITKVYFSIPVPVIDAVAGLGMVAVLLVQFMVRPRRDALLFHILAMLVAFAWFGFHYIATNAVLQSLFQQLK